MKPPLGLGLRTVKTAVAVCLCYLAVALARFLFPHSIITAYASSLYACAAAIVCMRPTVEDTVSMGVARVCGTFFGSAVACAALLLPLPGTRARVALNTLLLFAGVMLSVLLCNLAKQQAGCAIACVVFVVIVVAYERDANPYAYVLVRMAETVAGIVVAVLVNRFFRRPGSYRRSASSPPTRRPGASSDTPPSPACTRPRTPR